MRELQLITSISKSMASASSDWMDWENRYHVLRDQVEKKTLDQVLRIRAAAMSEPRFILSVLGGGEEILAVTAVITQCIPASFSSI
jgi:hypothetical protein